MCSSDLDKIKDEEDDARDNIPENLQSGETYETSEECSDVMSDALDNINDAIENLNGII